MTDASEDDFWGIHERNGFLPHSFVDPDVARGLDPRALSAHLRVARTLHEGDVRARILELPLLELAFSGDNDFAEEILDVRSARDRERAFAVFAFLTNAYVHTRVVSNSDEIDLEKSPTMMPMKPDSFARATSKLKPTSVPAVLGVPLCALANSVGRRPILDYASSVLVNFRPVESAVPRFPLEFFFDRVAFSFTDRMSERWFYAVHMAIEHVAGEAVFAIVRGSEEAENTLHRHRAWLDVNGPSRRRRKSKPKQLERQAALQSVLSHANRFALPDAVAAPPLPHLVRVSSSVVSLSRLAAAASIDSQDSQEDVTVFEALCDTLRELRSGLEKISAGLKDTVHVLGRMDEGCDPAAFYNDVRPWLAGYSKIGGVRFQGVSSGDAVREERYAGASGAQSTLMPLVDAFLGVKYGTGAGHEEGTSSDARTPVGKFISMLKSYRWHMPPQHRELLVKVESAPNARDVVSTCEETFRHATLNDWDADVEIRTERERIFDSVLESTKRAYNECVLELLNFRKRHTDYATRYVKAPSMKPLDLQSKMLGTGGSEFSTFLSKFITDTRRCLYPL